MKFPVLLTLFVISLGAQVPRQNYLITTRAGSSSLGNGGPAVQALLASPWSVATGSDGTIYFADSAHHQIRKIARNGIISAIAGTGVAGFNGDEGRAAETLLNYPAGLAVDSGGNVYFADTNNNRIRMVDSGGLIHTVAGNGISGFSGDGGRARSASLKQPYGVALDSQGRVLIADTYNNRIRLVDLNSEVITTLAGSSAGYGGDGGPAVQALINTPRSIAVDTSGNVYIADESNHRIRRISPGLSITTVAGNGTVGYAGDGGQATSARLSTPGSIAIDGQQLYIADTFNVVIRRVDLTTGGIVTFAGSARQGFAGDGGPPLNAQFNIPTGIAITTDHRVVVADNYNFRIRAIANNVVTTAAGRGTFGGDNGPASSALLDNPGQVTIDSTGNLLFTDTSNYCVRRVNRLDVVNTVAGTCTVFGSPQENSVATAAPLINPTGVVADKAGNVYIADTGNNRIRKVDVNGNLTTLSPGVVLVQPTFLALDASQNSLFVSETGANRITAIDLTSGKTATVGGTGTAGFSGDGASAALARFRSPQGIAVDGQGNVYVADTGNNRVRRIDASGIVRTYAGDGSTSYLEGPATSVGVPSPVGLAFDLAGNLFIGHQNWYLTRVDAASKGLSYVVGAPGFYTTFTGDGGLSLSASIQQTGPVVVDATGTIFLADRASNRIRQLTPLVPLKLQVAAGDGQNGPPGTILGNVFAVQVTGAAGIDLPGISVQFSVRSGDASLSATSVITDYSGYASVVITLGKQPGPVVLQAVVTGLSPVVVNETLTSPGPVPVINPSGVVALNSTSNIIQPGSWFSIYGSNLASGAFIWNGDFPTSLGNTRVTVNGKPAYLWYVSATQINAQAPDDSVLGPVPVIVQNALGTATSTVTLAAFSPTFNLLGDGKHIAGVILTADGSGAYGGYDLAGPIGGFTFKTRPVRPGEILLLFGTGFGETNPKVPAGTLLYAAAPAVNPIEITIGGVHADAAFAGLTAAGLFQFNLTVPNVGSGENVVQGSVGGIQSPTGVYITVQ